jgi:plastocyanin
VGAKKHRTIVKYALLSLGLATSYAEAQRVEVTAHVTVRENTATASKSKAAVNSAGVVIWLTALQPDTQPNVNSHSGPFRLIQKDKQFTPHLLIVPTGSSVEFPNQDPFFHNVFSLFNGKRFDLGLYESGSTRVVHFDREGISYIFCNIHPEMAAVVLSLSTSYYGVSNAAGAVTVQNVPSGTYRLHLWSENAQSAHPGDADRIVQVGTSSVRLDEIQLQAVANPMGHHKNKFGEDYKPSHESEY